MFLVAPEINYYLCDTLVLHACIFNVTELSFYLLLVSLCTCNIFSSSFILDGASRE